MYFIRYKLPCANKHLSIVFYEINGCVKDYEGSKYLILILANEKDKGLLTKYKNIFDTLKYLIKKNNNSDDCDEK